MEEDISRSNIESFKLSITKISQNRIDKYELVNIAKNLNIEISSAATFCIQKRMVLKELLSHVLRECQDQGYIFFFGQDRKYEELLQETISWLDFSKLHGYNCSFARCLFQSDRHKEYVFHIKIATL